MKVLVSLLALLFSTPAFAILPSEVDSIARVAPEGLPGLAPRDGERSIVLATDPAQPQLLLIGIQGKRRAVGDDAGAAYVAQTSGGSWFAGQPLVPNDARGGQGFGAAVALHGDLAAVTAQKDASQGALQRGAVYLFRRNGFGWQQEAKLLPPDGAFNGGFGASIAIRSDEVLVGAPNADGGGATYRFRRTGGAWDAGTLVRPAAVAPFDFFGYPVRAVADGYIVGAYQTEVAGFADAGVAYRLEDQGSGLVATQVLQSPTPANFGLFGGALATSGSRLAVLLLGQDRVQLFQSSGGTYVPDGAPLQVPDVDGARRGFALDGNRLYVGHPWYGATASGGIEVYSLASGAPFLETTLAPPASLDIEAIQFGGEVAATADFVAGSAPFFNDGDVDTGAVFSYAISGGNFGAATHAVPRDGADGDAFGASVAADDRWLVVGQPRFDVGTAAQDQGRAYLYRRSGAGWSLAQTFFSVWPAGLPTREFSNTIAFDGTRMFLSAPYGAVPNATGVVVEFLLVNDFWTPGAVIRPPVLEPDLAFGIALALRGDDAFVGVPFPSPGRVEVYRRVSNNWTHVETLLPEPARQEFGSALAFDGTRLVIGSSIQVDVYARTAPAGFTRRYSVDPQGPWGPASRRALSVQGSVLAVASPVQVELFELGDDAVVPRGTLTPPTSNALVIASLALQVDALYAGIPSAETSGRVVAWPRNGFMFGAPEVFVPPDNVERAQAFGNAVVPTTDGLVVSAPRAPDVATDSAEAGGVVEFQASLFADGFE